MRSSSAASSSTPRRRWSCGPTRAASTPIASSAGSRPTTRAEARAKATASADSNASERGTSRFGLRTRGLTPEQVERVRGGGWDLPLLQQVVDQFVIHFDVCGTSRRCFEVLQDKRGLSVHFMLDIDGTIYQTLDAKEAAWHATIANGRSIGIEIANIGAYPVNAPNPLGEWYQPDSEGRVRLVIPGTAKDGDPIGSVGQLRPMRNDKVKGPIQGEELVQYDFTPQQYEALAKLTATLCTVFPKIRCDYPRDEKGALITHKLPPAQYDQYHGVLGHYHVQTNKVDPGPAFQWDRVIGDARRLMLHWVGGGRARTGNRRARARLGRPGHRDAQGLDHPPGDATEPRTASASGQARERLRHDSGSGTRDSPDGHDPVAGSAP